MNRWSSFLVGLGMAALLGWIIYAEISVWNECREKNSWLYCMKVLSK